MLDDLRTLVEFAHAGSIAGAADGSRVLEQARDLLQRTEALKSLASSDAEPHGLLRIGRAHPLAERTLIDPNSGAD